MAESTEAQDAPIKTRRSKKPLAAGVLLAAILGAAGFYLTWSGLIAGDGPALAAGESGSADRLAEIAFVPIDPLLVSLGPGEEGRHLRFNSQLEVAQAHADEVTLLKPRIMDVMNGYLRALDAKSLDDPTVLVRMRAQLLRRIQIVTGEGRVRDLLVTEFVLN